MHGEDEKISKALELIQLREYAAAEQIYRILISDGTLDTRVFCNLAILCGMNGNQHERISLLEAAATLEPDNERVYSNLGVAHQEQGEILEAINFYRKALSLNPNEAEAHNNLGLALMGKGEYESAQESLKRAIILDAEFVNPYINLGKLYAETGQYSMAAEAYLKCAALQPGISSHLFELGLAQQNGGQLTEAIETYTNLLESEPQHPGSLLNLGIILSELGRADEAVYYFLSLLANDAVNTDALTGYGRALEAMGYLEEAFSVFNKVHELDPSNADVLNSLGLSLQSVGLNTEAVVMFNKALVVSPQHPGVLANLAVTLRSLGDLDSSIATFKQALVLNPDRHDIPKGLLFAYSGASEAYALENLELARTYWKQVRSKEQAPIQHKSAAISSAINPSSESPKIRIGFLCADIGQHVVSTFLLPFLREYDRSLFHVELISVHRRYEHQSSELVDCADNWYSLQGLGIENAREEMKRRGYDIIVETNGFTRNTGIELLAERCALVQCHYIGYHASTGLDTIDYFIGDAENLPEEFEWQFSERLWRLPRTWLACCPYHDYPPVNNVVQKDIPVLASFNQLTKVSNETMTYWAAALQKIPGSILLVKDRQCSDNNACKRIQNFMHKQGINPDRLFFLPLTADWNEHLQHYNLVDVVLDATPWSSATTAFDALGMGVPLVAIKGGCMSARMSSSIVKGIGKECWIASTPDAYANIVADLCEDLGTLRQNRAERQKEYLASKLFDSADMARCLQDAFISMLHQF